jgi:hypothetical protein
MRTTKAISGLLALGLSLGAASAQAQSGTITASAVVLSAITVAGTNNLLFGNVTPGVNKTVAITDAGAGLYTVTKAANQGLTLSFTLPANLTSGANNLPIGTWTGGWNTAANPATATAFTPSAAGVNTAVTAGVQTFVYVGATVSPAAAQVAGTYTGNVTMQAAYF